MDTRADPVRITLRDALAFALVTPVMIGWFIVCRIGGRMKPAFPLPWIAVRAAVNLVRPRSRGPLRDIRPDSGLGWIAPVSRWIPDDFAGESTVALFEDGRRLGPAHCLHDDIRRLGRGRYSHWGSWVYFSTSDGSDPTANGRHYSFEERSRADARREHADERAQREAAA